MKTLDIVVPFLNERENLPIMLERVTKTLVSENIEWRILFVDDGSSDGSTQWVAETAKSNPHVVLLRLSRNFGHQIAITAGMDYSRADAVVIIDADLQDPPEVIPELLARWREGNEVVYAVRKSREGETWLKKFLAASFYRVFHSLSKVNVPMDTGDFRLVDRKVIETLREVRELHRFMRGLTCWVGFRQCAVYYERAARHAGVTKYPVWKSVRLALDAVTSFSGAPLRWVTGTGFAVSFIGALWILMIIIRRLINPAGFEPGWTTIVAIIVFIGGIQLISIGMVGQYVSRIYEESKRRPLYILHEVIDAKSNER
ncbi:MAG TPA: glycosyltransferase family 2 protein [Kiritimatiellia bacterium]|nr:glycosyltransferase family 2 protein [Kiritimatiellia bacterium]